MEQDFFKNNEKFSGISPEKLEFLMKFASQNKSGNAKEMSNMILGAVNKDRKSVV